MAGPGERTRKKRETLRRIWEWVQEHDPEHLEFDNDLVKRISGEEDFSNQFDVTKVDTSKRLPDIFHENDVFMVHVGGGRHRFVRPIRLGYYPLPKSYGEPVEWGYKPGILNGKDDSEAGVLSLAYNNQVIQDFLFDNPREPVMIHLPRRTRVGTKGVSFDYFIGDIEVRAENLQIEMDFLLQTYPPTNLIAVAEAKRVVDPSDLPDFAITQVFLPFRRLLDLVPDRTPENVRCAFVVGFQDSEGNQRIRLSEYRFGDQRRLDSIEAVKDRHGAPKAKEYVLRKR
ncbi:hypothetical protein B1B_12862 [mine drainage metagenome]|uniref:Uncharacterized protein n=1 Tax=mine drainage metagenome TaxID=410659 RepID=T0ZCN4_9ZZZZ